MQMCSENEERTHLSSIGDSDTSLVEDGCMHAPLPTSGLDCMDAVSGMMDDGRDGERNTGSSSTAGLLPLARE